MKNTLITLGSLVLTLAGLHIDAAPLGTAFTYHGCGDSGTEAETVAPRSVYQQEHSDKACNLCSWIGQNKDDDTKPGQ